ncbi:hypothetical protein [Candidatus Enterococcus mansonii]|uniref:Uncharacterized protein n=1 Tax=Candidatus Enterococcus mansonii TaxID=1834181 RepID=A0A242CCZ1_9ENTE|nr:hypothetical protein [Enterococcus sp. 4G2_DIV0659]OTO07780.1 hypothetical protein A5880_002050 [Enterococcus sp. 4G2_DIV0659]
MEILDWLFIGLLSFAILCFVLMLIFLTVLVLTGKKLEQLRTKRPKHKLKVKKWKKACRRLIKKRNQQIRYVIFFLLIGIVGVSGAFYSRYYQATNLGKRDSDALIQGYFLIDGIEEQLNQVQEADNPKKIQGTLYDLSARLASYGAHSANGRLSEEGQKKLNRLYSNMKELGVNLGSQTLESLSNPETLKSYKSDVKTAQGNQKKVLKYFRINEASLKRNK